MPQFYVGQWEWVADSRGDFMWRAPGGGALGTVDLRTIPQMATAGGPPQGVGLFAYPSAKVHGNLLLPLGSDLDRSLTPSERAGLSQFVGLPASVTVATTVSGAIRQLLLDPTVTDPTGATRPKPLRANLSKRLASARIGRTVLFSERVTEAHPARQAVIDVFRADYARLREAGTPITLLRKFTGDALLRLGAASDSAAESLLPAPYSRDGWTPPTTTVTDDFNRADEALTTGGRWATPAETWAVVSNQCAMTTGAGIGYARHATALSSDDQIASVSAAVGGGAPLGVAVRFSSVAVTAYVITLDSTGSLSLSKTVSSTVTFFGQEVLVSISLPDTLNIDVRGSDLSGGFNGSTLIGLTDTAITGNLFGGLRGRETVHRWDDFSVADIALPIITAVTGSPGGADTIQHGGTMTIDGTTL